MTFCMSFLVSRPLIRRQSSGIILRLASGLFADMLLKLYIIEMTMLLFDCILVY